MKIPKKIHVSWLDKNVIEDSNNPIILNGIKNLRDMNTDWEFTISDNQDVDSYIKENISSKDYELIKDRIIVEKVDLWRLLKE